MPLVGITLAGAFVAAAVARRTDTQAHKRYMLMASIVMVEGAVARWPFAFMTAPSPIPLFDMPSLTTACFLVPLVVWDVRSRGRLHSATIAGVLAILAYHVLRMPLASTAAWQSFAGWAVRLVA